jgi:predicted NBD/HSP70 family sugar kinase
MTESGPGRDQRHVPPRETLRLDELKRNNMGRLLSQVHFSGPISRAALTQSLGLNRSTIGDLTSSLAELGLVVERGSVTTRRSGRPSFVVQPRQDVTVVGVNLGVDRITVALVALGGEVLSRRERPHQRGDHEVLHVVESLAQMIHGVLREHPDTRCLGVGVAVPGAVGIRDGIVRFAPNLGWVDAPFAEALSVKLGLSVVCDNDANLGARAEHLRGVAVGHDDVAYLSGSVGLGGGFIVGGQPLTGTGGYAGEIGHLSVDLGGPLCRCGNVGCWETKVGENQLLLHAGRLPGGGPEAVREVIAAAEAGEERASAALDEVADWLAVGLRAVINIFNPEMVVLGDSLALIWRARETQVDRRLGRLPLISPRQHLTITASGFDKDAPLVGAAELAFTPLLADPSRISTVPARLTS